MLVLARRIGESIMIGDDIKITFVGYHNGRNQIRLGIEAPKDVPVHREEVKAAIEQGIKQVKK